MPWIDLDPFIDVDFIYKNYDRFCWAIGKNYKYIMPATHGAGCLHNKKYQDLSVFLNLRPEKQPEGFSELVEGFRQKDLRFFCFNYFKSYAKDYNLILKGSNKATFSQKHLADLMQFYPASHDFMFFLDWLDSQHIFSSVGRVMLFLTEAKSIPSVYKDYTEGKNFKDQFVWITPNPSGKFFVYNTERQLKEFIKSTVSIYDNANWYGSESSDIPHFSIRVDGIFDDDFLNKANLKGHFQS